MKHLITNMRVVYAVHCAHMCIKHGIRNPSYIIKKCIASRKKNDAKDNYFAKFQKCIYFRFCTVYQKTVLSIVNGIVVWVEFRN